MSDLAEARPAGSTGMPALMRVRSGEQRVTNIELFFDLVYVFAITQLSHFLLAHPTVRGALQAGLLLAMVWTVWAYTTWVTNWLDPERMAVRLLLVALMLASLAMSISLPRGFGDLGLWVGGAYAVQQVGRSVFMVIALRGHPLQANYKRILAWCVASSALALGGGFEHGYPRDLLWVLAVGVDLAGGAVGFATPWLGRSHTSDWTIEGGHFAERCQAFILIALGESVVIIGATLSADRSVTVAEATGFVVAFAGSVALWWLYFDQSADAAARRIARSDDPGRLGRSAYHFIHPVMVAGIVVAAAADEKVLSAPGATASTASAWLILGGPALFLAGHAAFKFLVWRAVSWPRLAGIAVLALLAPAAKAIPALALATCAAAVVTAIAVTDRLPWLPHPAEPSPPISLPKLRACRVLGPKGRIRDAMSQPATDRYAWAEPGVEDLGGGVHRIPLPLPIDGLKAVNVYAIAGPGGVDLIDAGIALGPARERLTAALRELGYELGDVRNFFVTHVHIDHYSLAVELRKTFRSVVFLGEQERSNLITIREMVDGSRARFFGADSLRRLGALELRNELDGERRQMPAIVDWQDPDHWVTDGTDLDLSTRTLRAVHTPGHTRGHVVFHDAAAQIMFAGDHILPHITPSVGFEPADNRTALLDYLASLARTLALPDARLLPAHGPVTASTHERANELLAHHDQRLAETLQAVQAGNATPYEVAQAIKWTRRHRAFGDLDLFARIQAVNETAAHLEVLAVRGQLTHELSADGADIYQMAPLEIS